MTLEAHGQASTLRPVLTGLAREITNEEFIGNRVFTVVPSDSRLLEIEIFDNDLKALVNTKRALRGDSNIMVPGDGSTVKGKLGEHDAGWPVDVSEKKHAVRSLDTKATRKTKMNVDLVRESEQADLAQADSSYPADHVVTLSGTALWSDDASTPVEDMEAGKEKISEKIVMEPNTLVLGENVYRRLKFHPKLKAMLSDNEKKYVKLEDMKEIFDVEEILIGKAVYHDQVNSTNVKLWKDHAILYYIERNLKPKSPESTSLSFGYTFQEKGYPFTDEFWTNPGKVKVIRCSDSYLVIVVGGESGYKIKALA